MSMLAALTSALTGALIAAAPAPLPRHGIWVFSNLCVERRSGDFAGARVTLGRAFEGDWLLFEYGAGPLEGPVVADDLRISHGRFTATAITEDGQAFLSGRADSESMWLRYDFGVQVKANAPERLRRQRDLGAPPPVCR
jgi:hypothetical protein